MSQVGISYMICSLKQHGVFGTIVRISNYDTWLMEISEVCSFPSGRRRCWTRAIRWMARSMTRRRLSIGWMARMCLLENCSSFLSTQATTIRFWLLPIWSKGSSSCTIQWDITPSLHQVGRTTRNWNAALCSIQSLKDAYDRGKSAHCRLWTKGDLGLPTFPGKPASGAKVKFSPRATAKWATCSELLKSFIRSNSSSAWMSLPTSH